jgi:hypothetical protein
MKKHILFIAAGILMLGACTSSTKTESKDAKVQSADSTQIFNLDTNALAAGTIYYMCPMTEDAVISDKPGACPKCGMDLEPVTKQ